MRLVSAKMRRIVSGSDRKASRARKLYREIATGARKQQRIQGIFERRFFGQKFGSQQLVEEAGKLKGSRRQAIELREYAKRLARKRDYTLKRFKAWGLQPRHIGKPMEKTPSGASAKTIFYNLTGWRVIKAPVKMIALPDTVAFIVGPKEFREIAGKEVPKTKKPKEAMFLPGLGAIDAIIFPTIEEARKHLPHERAHAATAETPLIQELGRAKKQEFNPRTLEKFFGPTNLRLGAKRIGRGLVDELIANLAENDLNYFEKKYKTYYLATHSSDSLGPKTASKFMHNKSNYKARMLKAVGQSIKAVREALASYAVTPGGRRVKVINRKQLGALLTNIRDIEKVPKRLPVLIELRRNALKKRLWTG